MNRAYYIDRLRIILTMLVIFHHSAIAFGASGGWYYVTPNATNGITQMILTIFMAIDQAYFMSFFFFISALFMQGSFDRKGLGKFLKDRWIRLGIPLAVYTLLLHPTLVFSIFKYLDKPTGTWSHFVWVINSQHMGPGPMWFVLTLLIFETLYALYRFFSKHRIVDKKERRLPEWWQIAIFILGAGILAFCIRLVYPVGKSFFGLQFGYFILYVAMYITGIVASRNNWLERLTLKKAKPWFFVALFTIPLLIGIVALSSSPEKMNAFSGGINIQAMFYALWEPFICVGLCYFLLMYFKKHLNQPNRFVLSLSLDSYTAYIIHPFFVVGATFLSERIALPPLLRLIFVLALAIPGTFIVARLIRNIPGVKRIL
ncbi:MAG: acyltransferase family protein [Prolixibacteraceae bacterium]|nr:acyltransferase family protein [Prolixibacteraceae bacterium]